MYNTIVIQIRCLTTQHTLALSALSTCSQTKRRENFPSTDWSEICSTSASCGRRWEDYVLNSLSGLPAVCTEQITPSVSCFSQNYLNTSYRSLCFSEVLNSRMFFDTRGSCYVGLFLGSSFADEGKITCT